VHPVTGAPTSGRGPFPQAAVDPEAGLAGGVAVEPSPVSMTQYG
jgi:hypothetical protein